MKLAHFISLCLLLGTTLMLALACEKKGSAQTPGRAATTVPVTLLPAKGISVQRSVEVVGTLFGDEDTVISAKVPGRIIALYKDVGDIVQPGEALVQLKQNDYQLAVAKAQLAMDQTLAKLGLTELPPKDFDVSKVPTVVKTRLQVENAQAKFNRGKKLFEAKPPLMSEQDFADLETALSVAKSAYDVELLNNRAIVAEAWALKGDLDIANQRLTDATTRAPSTPEATTQPVDTGKVPGEAHTYVVTARMVNVGELVREITPCYRLVDDTPIKLRAKVPERYIAEVKTGQKVKTNVEAYPGVDFVGTISRLNPQIDSDNRTFSIEVLIPNDDHRLKPGAFARARVETRMEENVLFVPQESVVTFAGVNKVYGVKGDKAIEMNVDPGDARADVEGVSYVEIAKASPAIKPGDPIVTTGTSKLAAGVPVTIKKPSTTRATGE